MHIVFAGEKAFEVYETLMAPLKTTFPCDQAEIIDEHEKCMKEAIDVFRKDTLMDPDVNNFKTNLTEFTVRTNFF